MQRARVTTDKRHQTEFGTLWVPESRVLVHLSAHFLA